MRWKVIFCGSRSDTFGAFKNALNGDRDSVCVLLVDSEEQVPAGINCAEHVRKRDGWTIRHDVADRVHLMIQCMESWLVADPGALQSYYGQKFAVGMLPQRDNLEEEPKTDILSKLRRATHGTQKGEYQKIRHASAILSKLDSAVVARRCQSFGALLQWLNDKISTLGT